MTARLDLRFQRVAAERRAALVTFIMAGDPDGRLVGDPRGFAGGRSRHHRTWHAVYRPDRGRSRDSSAGRRALDANQTLPATLRMVKQFRAGDPDTPLILMGYYNPIYIYGVETFLTDAKAAGVDGLIIVDCPPEEDDEICLPTRRAGLAFVRFMAPTTSEDRLPEVLENAGGFVYFVSITGVTGAAAPNVKLVAEAVGRLKRKHELPVAVGFGVRTPKGPRQSRKRRTAWWSARPLSRR